MNYRVDQHIRGSWTQAAGAAFPLPAKSLRWLVNRVGELGTAASTVPDSAIAVSSSLLTQDARSELVSVVGVEYVLDDPIDRLGRTGGLSYQDLMRRRVIAGERIGELAVPDAVVLPGDPDEVQRVLEVCADFDVGVVPFGGGTSVVGGVNSLRGNMKSVVVLDLARLNKLVNVDHVSRLAVFEAGVCGPDAERMLAEYGLTLGHVPQSFERATIGGFAATRSAGQASAGYGRFEDIVEGVRLATPKGQWRLGTAPASAAGPDLRQLAIGSEGTLGVITEVVVRVRPIPPIQRFAGYVIDGWKEATGAVRELAQQEVLADITRLSDADETAVSLTLNDNWKTTLLRRYLSARKIGEPCLLVLGWHGSSRSEIAKRRAVATRILRRSGAVSLGKAPGESWRKGRFSGPRQRDALIDNGVCVETLETATYWSKLDELYTSVRSTLDDLLRNGQYSPIVVCHLSHAYETGASLYFTVLAARDDADPIGQWQLAKDAACAAIVDGVDGPLGTISHHHAVGVDHAPYLASEIGAIGVSAIAAVKSTVDPKGILNPGKLVR